MKKKEDNSKSLKADERNSCKKNKVRMKFLGFTRNAEIQVIVSRDDIDEGGETAAPSMVAVAVAVGYAEDPSSSFDVGSFGGCLA